MIRSPLFAEFPELVHGFSTLEDGPVAAIKLTPEKLVNRQAFLESLGVLVDRVAIPHQVHGIEIKQVDETNLSAFDQVDAMITDQPDIYLTVFTADCLPVFIYDPIRHKVATVHLGWRGLTQKLLGKVIANFTDPADLVVWVGPHIHDCHYKISPESASSTEKLEAFARWPEAIKANNNETFLDLTRVIMGQLTDIGVHASRVEIAQECTACRPDKYYSYHMTKGQQPGQMMGVLGFHHA